MNTFRSQRFALLLVVLLPAWGAIERAQAAPPSDDTPPSAAAPAEDSPTRDAPLDLDSGERAGGARPGRRHRHGNSVVSMGHDSILRGDEHADSVVSIFGSSTSAGEAGDVVSILGDTRVSGPVKDSAVAVLGDTYVDSPVDGSVVAVLGNVELGPHADIGGDVVAVGGKVTRDAASIIHGNVNSIAGGAAGAAWLRPWIDHCLLYARPLALVPGIGWAWGLACALWALYLGLALLFREAITECVNTLETQPGTTALAALLTLLLIPVLLVLLCITVIGLVAVPFLGFALFCAGLFGKAVIATSANRIAAQLVGIDTRVIVGACYALSAAIGAIAGVLVTPITLTSYNAGTLLALKGFAAVMLGGIGSAVGAVIGGVLLGLFEAFAAGYLSAKYKDAVAFLVILAVLSAMPQGLFGKKKVERV